MPTEDQEVGVTATACIKTSPTGEESVGAFLKFNFPENQGFFTADQLRSLADYMHEAADALEDLTVETVKKASMSGNQPQAVVH